MKTKSHETETIKISSNPVELCAILRKNSNNKIIKAEVSDILRSELLTKPTETDKISSWNESWNDHQQPWGRSGGPDIV